MVSNLVPLSGEHLEHEIELDADPDVMRFLGNGRARTRKEVELLHRERLAVASRVPGLGFWAGFVNEAFVGWRIWSHRHGSTKAPSQGGPSWDIGSCVAIGAPVWPARELVS